MEEVHDRGVVQLMVNDAVADSFFLARWQTPYIKAQAEPDQFVNIESSAGIGPLLRIPPWCR